MWRRFDRRRCKVGQHQQQTPVLALRWRYRLSGGPAASVIFGRVLPTSLRRGRLGGRLTFGAVVRG